MSTSTNLQSYSLLNDGQSGGVTSSRPTSSHASSGTMDETFQKAVQEYVKKQLLDEDKTAFLSAPDVIERLQEMQCNSKPLISGSLTTRVEKVLQCVKAFMGSLGIFIQHSPEISSLVVGGVNCILTVGTTYKQHPLYYLYKPGLISYY